MVVNVFLEQDDGSYRFEGKAVLIERRSTWYTPEPFPIVDSCNLCGTTTNNIKQKWLVDFITNDKFKKTYIVERNIHKFHSYGTPHVRDELDDQNDSFS